MDQKNRMSPTDSERLSSSVPGGSVSTTAATQQLSDDDASVSGRERDRAWPWYSRLVAHVEENPLATASGLAAAAGVLLGAGKLAVRKSRSTPTEVLKAKLAEVLAEAVDVVESAREKSHDWAEQISDTSQQLRKDTGEQLTEVRNWIDRSASRVVDDLGPALQRTGRQSLDTVSRAVQKRPVLIGAGALAAITGVAAFWLTRTREETKTGARTSSARTVRRSQPYEARSRDELYQLANELGVEGRSSMSKDELIAAIREAS